MKRAVVRIRLGYRKWTRYINSPSSTKKPNMTEYILLVAICAAITIKFKGQIEAKLFHDQNIKPKYHLYYDYVEPQGP
jgi:hypothetical protein